MSIWRRSVEGTRRSGNHPDQRILGVGRNDTADQVTVGTEEPVYVDKPLAGCTIRDWSFTQPFDGTRLTNLEGAVADSSIS